MGEIINLNTSDEMQPVGEDNELLSMSEELLTDVGSSDAEKHTMRVPIAELSTLGAGVASLIPALNTVTSTTTFAADGLYRVANAPVGAALKAAKNGNFWGAFKTADGASKLAQLQAADPISATTSAVEAFNPAMMMMAVALYSIERQLGRIEDMEKEIMDFLETEKEAEIEADVKTLMGIVRKYKLSWDNERFVSDNHRLILDIQTRARKHINSYQKRVSEIISKKQLVVAQTNVNAAVNSIEKNFKYYRLSMYNFSLASFLEIMLSGNFKEEYISEIEREIREMNEDYRKLFGQCSVYLEKLGGSAVETNVLKGVGTAGKAVGKFIGSIPVIKKGPVDEFLQDSGAHLKKNAKGMEKKAVHRFALLSNPGTGLFLEKLEDLKQIYNHTSEISFDQENIYLVTA